MKTRLWNMCVDLVLLPLVGLVAFMLIWQGVSSATYDAKRGKNDFPSPVATFQASSKYLAHPFTKGEDGELDGLGLQVLYSLWLVARGYLVAIVVAVPIGFALGASKSFTKCFDPVFQVLRPVSPLAWYPLAGVITLSIRKHNNTFDATTWQCILTIGICALWPTVLNTAVGVRAIPQDYLNVAKVLRLGKVKTLAKIMFPAALPYMFTGFRLSLGIAWLVIVAAEMLSGKTGIGAFVNDCYQTGDYGSMITAIGLIGIVGFILDRLMTVVEKNVDWILGIPGLLMRIIRGGSGSRGREVAHVPA